MHFLVSPLLVLSVAFFTLPLLSPMVHASKSATFPFWKLFRHVTWPLLTPAINTNFLLNVIGSLQSWQLFLILTGYKPGTQVLGYVIFAEGFGQTGGASASFRQGFAAAASVVLFVLVLVLGMIAQWIVIRREKKYAV